MKTSPILGLPIEETDDTRKDFPTRVDEPRTVGLETYTIPRFPNLAARNAAIPTPVAGMMCYLTDTGTTQQHNGYVWVGDTAPTALTPINGFTAADYLRCAMNYLGFIEVIIGVHHANASANGIACVLPPNYRPTLAGRFGPANRNDGFVNTPGSGLIAGNGDVTPYLSPPTSPNYYSFNTTYRVDPKTVR